MRRHICPNDTESKSFRLHAVTAATKISLRDAALCMAREKVGCHLLQQDRLMADSKHLVCYCTVQQPTCCAAALPPTAHALSTNQTSETCRWRHQTLHQCTRLPFMCSCGSSPVFAGGSRPLSGRTLRSCKALQQGCSTVRPRTAIQHIRSCDGCSGSHLSLQMCCIKLQRA
jgi:hypothetical protein